MVTKEDFIFITGASGFIGTNLIELFEEKGYRFVNYDKADVTKKDQHKYWHEGNIMDKVALSEAFDKYKPTIVIHLAARTDTRSTDLNDYIENTEGTENVVNEIKKHDYVKHALFASTQYVYKDRYVPFGLTDTNYAPHTVYGVSKKMDEDYIRSSDMKCKWTIFRPCAVWGPWHRRNPVQIWKMIDQGRFVYPRKSPVIRTGAYVKNLVRQLDAIMNGPDELTNHKTYYLGDMPHDAYRFNNTFSLALTGKNVKRLPNFVFALGGLFGDLVRKLGGNFPLYTVRYRNMVEDYISPSNVTIALFGGFSQDMEANIKETVAWLEGEGAELFDYWKNRKEKRKNRINK